MRRVTGDAAEAEVEKTKSIYPWVNTVAVSGQRAILFGSARADSLFYLSRR